MTYKINGVELSLQPTTGKWMPRLLIDVDGNGYPVYSAVREFELMFQLTEPTDFQQLQNAFNSLGVTGTAVVDLPAYATGTYSFFPYSGCVLREPEMAEYFSEHHMNVRLLITNIRT